MAADDRRKLALSRVLPSSIRRLTALWTIHIKDDIVAKTEQTDKVETTMFLCSVGNHMP